LGTNGRCRFRGTAPSDTQSSLEMRQVSLIHSDTDAARHGPSAMKDRHPFIGEFRARSPNGGAWIFVAEIWFWI